jgi:hypothetical protein
VQEDGTTTISGASADPAGVKYLTLRVIGALTLSTNDAVFFGL